MKSKVILLLVVFFSFYSIALIAQPVEDKAKSEEAKAKSDEEVMKRAGEWVTSLTLNNVEKEARVKDFVATHLKLIRDWHNEHPPSTVPEGINPATGIKLNELDRQVIATSAMPKSIHENLMSGLRKDLSEEQVEMILDKYTIGKVAFTLNGYKSIVPDLTEKEEAYKKYRQLLNYEDVSCKFT